VCREYHCRYTLYMHTGVITTLRVMAVCNMGMCVREYYCRYTMQHTFAVHTKLSYVREMSVIGEEGEIQHGYPLLCIV